MKNNVWSKIKNGLKKAVEFVVNVLLFIPRFLINGIKGFFNKEESESEELEEEFDDKDESEKPVEATEEPKQEETVVETATEEEKSNSAEETDDKVEEKSEANKPVEAEEPKQEETVVESTDKKVEVKITVAAAKEPQATETTADKVEEKSVEATEEQPKQEVTDDKVEEKSEANKPVEAEEPKQEVTVVETATEEEKSNSAEETDDNKPVEATEEQPKQEVTEEPQKTKKSKKASAKTTTKVEKVVAEVVDNQTGKVVKDNVNVEASTGEKEIPVFAKTDKKAAPFEKGFITYFNGAVKKYNKSLWLDGATEIQKFAKAYLDAIAIKENINAPKDDTRYEDIMKALKDAKIMSDPDEKFLKSCLGKQYFQGTENVQERLNAVYVFMGNYQLYYYPEWCASVKPQPFNGEATA